MAAKFTWLTGLINFRNFAAFSSPLALYVNTSAASEAGSNAGTGVGVSSGMMLQTGFGLLLVLALLFAVAYILRRFNGGRGFGSRGPLRVVGGLMLGPRERIVLVEIGETWLVIGIGQGQMRTLHTLPKGDLPAENTGDKPFGDWLKQMVHTKNENR